MGGASTARLAWITQQCPDVLAGAGFLYRRGQLLARLADVPRVRAVARRRISKVEKLDVGGFALLRLAGSADALALAEEVARRHGEPLATPNHVFRGEAAAASEVRAATYAGGVLCAPEAVPYLPPPVPVRGRGPSPRVAVLDTGWVLHRWLWRIPANLDLDPEHAEENLDLDALGAGGLAGHGTFAAGLVLRACPEARIVFRRVLDSAGLCDEVQLATALAAVPRAPEGTPDVVLVPAGGYTWGDRSSAILAAALAALPTDIAVVAAAGNAGADGRPFWPAAEESVIAVGALTRDDAAAPFSNRGPWVDAATLGTELESAFPDLPRGRLGAAHVADGYARWSGTSFAAAIVAGVVAARVNAKGQSGADAARSVLAAAAIARHFGPTVRRIPTPAPLARIPAPAGPDSAAPASDGALPERREPVEVPQAGDVAADGPHADPAAGEPGSADPPAGGASAAERTVSEEPALATTAPPATAPVSPQPATAAPVTPPAGVSQAPAPSAQPSLTRGHPVGVGFAPPGLPGQPLPRRRSLEPATDYLFWFELGQAPARERDPAAVAVVLARFDGELVIPREAAVGEVELRSDGGVTVTRQPSAVADPRRLYFPVRTPAMPGVYRLRCSLSHGETLLQSLLVEVRVGAPRWSIRPATAFTVDYRAPGE